MRKSIHRWEPYSVITLHVLNWFIHPINNNVFISAYSKKKTSGDFTEWPKG